MQAPTNFGQNVPHQIDRQNTQIGQIEPNSTDQLGQIEPNSTDQIGQIEHISNDQNPPLTESDHSGQIEPYSTDQNPPLTEANHSGQIESNSTDQNPHLTESDQSEKLKNDKTVAKELGLSFMTIYNWKRELGQTAQHKYTHSEQKELMKHKTVAKELGLSFMTIYNWKRELGQTERKKYSQSEQKELMKRYNEIKNQTPKISDGDIAKMLKIGGSTLAALRPANSGACRCDDGASTSARGPASVHARSSAGARPLYRHALDARRVRLGHPVNWGQLASLEPVSSRAGQPAPAEQLVPAEAGQPDEIFGEGWWDNDKDEEWNKLTLEQNFHHQNDRQNTQIGQIESNSTDQIGQIEPNSTDMNPPLTESDQLGQIEPNSTDQIGQIEPNSTDMNPPLTESDQLGQFEPNSTDQNPPLTESDPGQIDEIFGEGWWDNDKDEEWNKLTLEQNFHHQNDRQNTQIGQIESNSTDQIGQIEPNSTDMNPPLTESDQLGQIEPNSTDQNPPLTEWKNQFKRQQLDPDSTDSVEVNAATNVQEIDKSNSGSI
uniref:Uncharacterized protein n=1 Tax=Globodera rostochiensis TaxID=31243 RepID=A0A914H835_GLORO